MANNNPGSSTSPERANKANNTKRKATDDDTTKQAINITDADYQAAQKAAQSGKKQRTTTPSKRKPAKKPTPPAGDDDKTVQRGMTEWNAALRKCVVTCFEGIHRVLNNMHRNAGNTPTRVATLIAREMKRLGLDDVNNWDIYKAITEPTAKEQADHWFKKLDQATVAQLAILHAEQQAAARRPAEE